MSAQALEAIERILDLGEDPDDVLRGVVAELVREPRIAWVGIQFLEDGVLVLGPEAGAADAASRTAVPVTYQGTVVGELAADGEADVGIPRAGRGTDLDPCSARVGHGRRGMGAVS